MRHRVVACLQVGLCDTRWWLVYRSVCVTQDVACLQVGLCDTRWWLVYRSVCVTQGGGLFTGRSV